MNSYKCLQKLLCVFPEGAPHFPPQALQKQPDSGSIEWVRWRLFIKINGKKTHLEWMDGWVWSFMNLEFSRYLEERRFSILFLSSPALPPTQWTGLKTRFGWEINRLDPSEMGKVESGLGCWLDQLYSLLVLWFWTCENCGLGERCVRPGGRRPRF